MVLVLEGVLPATGLGAVEENGMGDGRWAMGDGSATGLGGLEENMWLAPEA